MSLNAVTPNIFNPTFASMEDLKTFIETEIEKAVTPLKEEIKDLRATLNETQELLAKKCQEIKGIKESVIVALTKVTQKPQEEPKPEATPTIETSLDLKACDVVHYLREEVQANDFGRFTLDRKALEDFLQTKVTRQLKSDIFKRAVTLFPHIVEIVISRSGNKTRSLALKPSFKCPDTYTFVKTAPLGILA